MTSWLPNVVAADYESEYRLRVRFNDGSEKILDFEGWLRGPVFEPVRDLAFFRRIFIEGGTVAWPNGADIAPETLYEAEPADLPAEPRGSAGDNDYSPFLSFHPVTGHAQIVHSCFCLS